MESSWKEGSALRRVRLALIFQRSTSFKHNRRNYKKYWRNWCSIQHSCWFVPIKQKIALDLLSLSAGNRGLYRDRGILKERNFIYEDHAWRSLGDLGFYSDHCGSSECHQPRSQLPVSRSGNLFFTLFSER